MAFEPCHTLCFHLSDQHDGRSTTSRYHHKHSSPSPSISQSRATVSPKEEQATSVSCPQLCEQLRRLGLFSSTPSPIDRRQLYLSCSRLKIPGPWSPSFHLTHRVVLLTKRQAEKTRGWIPTQYPVHEAGFSL